jgi:hypothetical protein
LLLILSYIVIGSIITAADTVSNTRKDITLMQEERLGTSIKVANYHYDIIAGPIYEIHFRVLNNGNQVISNINKTEVFFYHGSDTPKLLTIGSGTVGTNTWEWIELNNDTAGHNEKINPKQWDPGEYLFCEIQVDYVPSGVDLLDVILANGGKASTTTAIYRET